MKKILSLVLVLLFVVSAFSFSAIAADEQAYITLDREKIKGVSELPIGYYKLEEHLETIPVTFEAWVNIPSEVHTKRAAGVIFGNSYGTSQDDSVTFRVIEKGVPSLLLRDNDGNEYNFEFKNAKVPADKWTHVAIVYGAGTDNKQVLCYINGELKESSDGSVWCDISERLNENLFCLAGDHRPLNAGGFRGKLGDVAIYSDVRTAEEIASDAKNKPDTSDKDLLMYYDMSTATNGADIKDSSNNGRTMKYYPVWLTAAEQKAAAADNYKYTYSIAFLPDIQYTTDHFPKKLPNAFDWLIDNKDKKNIKYLIALGDITDHSQNHEWTLIKEQFARLDGVLDYSLIRGNHDSAALFDAAFKSSTPYYKHVQANGGMMKEKSVVNTYLFFEVGEVKYMIINLDFGATDDVLSWVDSILEANPDRRAIIVTHGYVNHDGTRLSVDDYASPNKYNEAWNSGDDMWEKCFKKHANVQIVVSGHICSDDILCTEVKGDNGNVVYQILMDTQASDDDLKGAGFVGLMHFTEDGNHARVEYYSASYKKYFRGANNDIRLHFVPEEAEETAAVAESTEEAAASETEAVGGGCASNVTFVGMALVAALGACATVVVKKKED